MRLRCALENVNSKTSTINVLLIEFDNNLSRILDSLTVNKLVQDNLLNQIFLFLGQTLRRFKISADQQLVGSHQVYPNNNQSSGRMNDSIVENIFFVRRKDDRCSL